MVRHPSCQIPLIQFTPFGVSPLDVFYYKNHVLYYSIDLEGKNSHAHNVYVNPKTGEIGRKTHSKDNYLELSAKEWNLVNKFSKWKKK